jgi:hypothetical protein
MDHTLEADLHIAELLRELLLTGLPILLSRDAIAGEFFGDLGPVRRSAASTLEGVLEGLTDHPRMKVCSRDGCISRGRPKPLWAFGLRRDSSDGHASVCRACEAKRSAEAKHAKSVLAADHGDEMGEAGG